MELDEITPGCRLDILEMDEKENKSNKTYKSSLYSVLDNDTIEATVPTVRARLIPLDREREFYFVFITDKGLLRTKGVVTDIYKRGNFYLMKVHLNGHLSKYQRREFYRIDCMIPVIYQSLSDEQGKMKTVREAEESLKKPESRSRVHGFGTIMDISGGGAKITSKLSLIDVPYVLLKFQMDVPGLEKMPVTVIAKVINSENIEGVDLYCHRVRFMFRDSANQEKIVRFIFEKERLLRRKEN